MWDRMLGQVFGEGVRPPVARWEPEEERLLQAVADGHGVTLITEGRARNLRMPGVAIKRFTDPVPTVPIGLAWRRDDTAPAVHRFIESTPAPP